MKEVKNQKKAYQNQRKLNKKKTECDLNSFQSAGLVKHTA